MAAAKFPAVAVSSPRPKSVSWESAGTETAGNVSEPVRETRPVISSDEVPIASNAEDPEGAFTAMSVRVTAQLPTVFIAVSVNILPFPAIFTDVTVSGMTIRPPDSGRFETSIVLEGASCDQSEPPSPSSSHEDGINTVLFSPAYAVSTEKAGNGASSVNKILNEIIKAKNFFIAAPI